MESRDRQPAVETLHNLEGRPLGRLVAPRPGPVIGRAAGTMYLMRTPGASEARGFGERRCSIRGR
jgi:hypothetical protein